VKDSILVFKKNEGSAYITMGEIKVCGKLKCTQKGYKMEYGNSEYRCMKTSCGRKENN
jgi:hypothetical protein